MSEMIKRVALAMQEACEGPIGDFEKGQLARPHVTYVKCASVAIEAMREPTSAMLDELDLANCGWGLRERSKELWQDLIDIALKGSE